MNSINLNPYITFGNINPVHKRENQPNISQAGLKVDTVEKTVKLKTPQEGFKMLFGLLKSSLNGETANADTVKGMTYTDWDRIIKMSNYSAVTPMVYDSVKDLPKESIPEKILKRMQILTMKSEIQHAKQEDALADLSKKFADKGIETIQLKGIGLSMDYPVPQHRYGGDIDIFTRKKGTVTHGYSNSWNETNKIMLDEGVDVEDYRRKHHKHSEFQYKGTNIENHNYFLNKESIPEAGKIDAYLHKVINPRERVLPNGAKILVPSKEFNSVFLAHHAFQHFVFGGMNMHNLTDWAVHLKKDGLNFPEELKGTKFEKFVYALTGLSNKLLGTEVKVPEDKEYKRKIFEKMTNPPQKFVPSHKNKALAFLDKIKWVYNNEKVAAEYTGGSAKKAMVDLVLQNLTNPKSILRKI